MNQKITCGKYGTKTNLILGRSLRLLLFFNDAAVKRQISFGLIGTGSITESHYRLQPTPRR